MHGTSHVSSAISICRTFQNFITVLSPAAIAQQVRRWAMDHKVISGENSRPLVD